MMSLIPRWKYMTRESKTLVKTIILFIVAIYIALFILRELFPILIILFLTYWIARFLFKENK